MSDGWCAYLHVPAEYIPELLNPELYTQVLGVLGILGILGVLEFSGGLNEVIVNFLCLYP